MVKFSRKGSATSVALNNRIRASQSIVPSRLKVVRRRSQRRGRRPMDVDGGAVVTAPVAGTAIYTRRYNPQFTMSDMGMIICNTELLTAVSSTAAFANSRAALIPSNLSWLEGVANNFSKWRWLYLRFIYIPVCPTSTQGQVVLGFSYDHNDNAPASVAAAQQAYQSVTAPYWAGWEGSALLQNFNIPAMPGAICSTLDVRRLGGPLGDAFYRFANLGNFGGFSNTIKNIYSPGILDITTTGGPVVSVLAGNIFAEYAIEVIEPVNPTANA
nr:MAG: putative coat protein [Macanavirus sp.]